jgi:CheY-like chemotaxis protein
METETPHPLLVIAVVEDNPADVYCIARVLHAHGLQYVLQVLESSQRTLHFFDRLAAQDGGMSPDLLLLDFTLPGLDMRALLQWINPTASFNSLPNVLVRKSAVTARSWLTSGTLRWSWTPSPPSVSSGNGTFGGEIEV